jgi:hypothetical protein
MPASNNNTSKQKSTKLKIVVNVLAKKYARKEIDMLTPNDDTSRWKLANAKAVTKALAKKGIRTIQVRLPCNPDLPYTLKHQPEFYTFVDTGGDTVEDLPKRCFNVKDIWHNIDAYEQYKTTFNDTEIFDGTEITDITETNDIKYYDYSYKNIMNAKVIPIDKQPLWCKPDEVIENTRIGTISINPTLELCIYPYNNSGNIIIFEFDTDDLNARWRTNIEYDFTDMYTCSGMYYEGFQISQGKEKINIQNKIVSMLANNNTWFKAQRATILANKYANKTVKQCLQEN